MKAVPVSQKKSMQPENVKKLQRLPGSSSPSSSGPDLTFGGLPVPKLEATYEPMIVKEARYIAITMMKVSLRKLAQNSVIKSLVYTERAADAPQGGAIWSLDASDLLYSCYK